MSQFLKPSGTSVLIFAALFSYLSQAESLFLFDFDNTLVETRAEYNGSFQTDFYFFQIENKGSSYLNSGELGPWEVAVQASDFQIIAEPRYRALISDNLLFQRVDSRLGTEEELIGDLTPYTLVSGEVIVPGHYRIIRGQSFKRFYSDPKEQANYLLEDFDRALENGKRLQWQGPAWPLFASLVSDKNLRDKVGIVSARGHRRRDWKGLFKRLKAEGFIEHSVNKEQIHAVSHPDYAYAERSGEISRRKLVVLQDYLASFNRMKKSDALVSSADDPNVKTNSHVLFFADDSQEVLKTVIEDLKSSIRSRLYKAKVIILNTGSELERSRSLYPEITVIRTDGTLRAGTIDEILELLPPAQKAHFLKQKTNAACANLLMPKVGK